MSADAPPFAPLRRGPDPGGGPGPAAGLRAAFRGHPAGVAVLTAAGPDGPVGMTASSVASVGVDPPAVSFSLDRASRPARALHGSATLVVHLLDDTATALAAHFAVPGGDRFAGGVRWTTLPTGEPWLPDVGTALRCRVLSVTGVGASVLVAAAVVEVLGLRRSGSPLVYVDRGYRRATAVPG
ncbi:flavin reductase family protein [Pseudonocardia spirodelae]|uniref:Flavin reductase family protein n=1 Tax=Pseudonocardia spirodelae TaxID=3133431 RepID=A0ABU8T6M2_9PSEU